jgi:hypothetical protein
MFFEQVTNVVMSIDAFLNISGCTNVNQFVLMENEIQQFSNE